MTDYRDDPEMVAHRIAARGSGMSLDIDVEQDIMDRTEGVSWRVLGFMAGVLEKAAIDLNNDGFMLPEVEFKALQKECRYLTALSEFYATLAVQRIDDDVTQK